MRLANLALAAIALVLPQAIESQDKNQFGFQAPFTYTKPSTEIMWVGGAAFTINGEDGSTELICARTVTEEPHDWLIKSVSGCELQPGHTLDEVISVMTSELTKKSMEAAHERDKSKQIYAYLCKHLQADHQRHGIPIKKGEPKS